MEFAISFFGEILICITLIAGDSQSFMGYSFFKTCSIRQLYWKIISISKSLIADGKIISPRLYRARASNQVYIYIIIEGQNNTLAFLLFLAQCQVRHSEI